MGVRTKKNGERERQKLRRGSQRAIQVRWGGLSEQGKHKETRGTNICECTCAHILFLPLPEFYPNCL